MLSSTPTLCCFPLRYAVPFLGGGGGTPGGADVPEYAVTSSNGSVTSGSGYYDSRPLDGSSAGYYASANAAPTSTCKPRRATRKPNVDYALSSGPLLWVRLLLLWHLLLLLWLRLLRRIRRDMLDVGAAKQESSPRLYIVVLTHLNGTVPLAGTGYYESGAITSGASSTGYYESGSMGGGSSSAGCAKPEPLPRALA